MLTRLDELYLPHHCYLDATDECYFGGDYTAGRGYAHSSTNQLIYNLKKEPHRRGLPEWHYKVNAIRQAAANLRAYLTSEYLASATFVPVPPSKIASDPEYDDRMTQVLQLLAQLLSGHVDVRELVRQRQSMGQAHTAASRPGPTELYYNYEIVQSLTTPPPSQVAVVDDVLTTGAHFKAIKRIVTETYPGIEVVGIFIARRVPETE
jgi:predicted amidophosphoribosyltransferase